MKLKDLVANSLPRVRGKKKKAVVTIPPPASPASSSSTITTTKAVVAAPESGFGVATNIPTNGIGFDKNRNRFHTSGSRSLSHEIFIDGPDIAEASWRGNALYRGLERERAVEMNSRMMTSSYTSSRGIVTSHSAEGFSSQLMMMSRSYDSRMAVSDYNGSCSQMSSISETGVEPYIPQQHQYYHCHYHRHNHHHHYHHHHVHPKPMTPLALNQQELNTHACPAKFPGSFKAEEVAKSEPGFFRKSFASFRSMRKHSSKSSKDNSAKAAGTDQMRCSVCPYPDTTLPDRKSAEKRPAKPKRKGLKGFSRFKENKELPASEKCDKSWYSDNDTIASPTISRADPSAPILVPYERSRVRECSVESCSSRLYGSREGSCAREVDPTGFDSASLSGYESDLPRSKVHRSRSRIKTNPWLPSPQPSLTGGRRADGSDLRESKEDIAAMEEQALRVPRSASFEYQKSGTSSFQMLGSGSMNRDNSAQRHRSLTPSDLKTTLSLDRASKSPPVVKKSTWWTVNQVPQAGPTKCKATPAQSSTLNDLSSDAPRSRPTSIVSPNSEFVMLADNLEQLANNISFEYEDMLDSTLESVSVCQEDGQASIQELLTDEENGNAAKKNQGSGFLKSEGGAQNAHSPDSGIGGLGSSDGDDAQTPGAGMELKVVSMDCMSTPGAPGRDDQTFSKQLSQSVNFPVMNRSGDGKRGNIFGMYGPSDSGDRRHRNIQCDTTDYKVQINTAKQSARIFKSTVQDDDSSATISESDIDNTSYQDNSNITYNSPDHSSNPLQKRSSPLLRCKTEAHKCNTNPALMVEERLDIQFQPVHRHFYGPGVVMGTGASSRDPVGYCKGNGVTGATPCRYSDPTDGISRRAARPNVLKTNPSATRCPRQLNDMEKGAGKNENGRPWSDEFDFPRNITVFECVESPTENWQCDGQFSMCSSQDTVVLEQAICDTNSNLENHKHQNMTDCFQNVELVVKLDDNDAASLSQHTAEMASENTSLMDCNLDKLDTESHDASFEMNDACVQTDFDDDFSRWDEVDTLESLEENAMDPAESTRIWLLTGNMQGSADTGYSSLTRDSQILMDEDTLFLAGELEERAAAERLSFGEYSTKNSSGDRTPRNSAYLELAFGGAPTLNNQPVLLAGEVINPPISSTDDIRSTENKSPKDVRVENPEPSGAQPQVVLRQKSGTLRSIPQATVNQMFSNIESQFQEIFQQIHDQDHVSRSAEAKRNSSDSSDSTLKSFTSCDRITGGIPLSAQVSMSQTSDFDTGKNKTGSSSKSSSEARENKYEDHDYVNVPSSKCGHVHSHKNGNHGSSKAGLKDANGNLIGSKLLPNIERPSHVVGLCRAPKRELIQPHKSSKSQLKTATESDRADYLEFLRDEPLDRSHLKRPLFLVPGIGPVDMSSAEQVNIFGQMPATVTIPVAATSSPAMSPLTTHCGKKVRCKRKDHKECGGDSERGHGSGPVSASEKQPSVESVPNSKFQTFPRKHHTHSGKHESKIHRDDSAVPSHPQQSFSAPAQEHQHQHHHHHHNLTSVVSQTPSSKAPPLSSSLPSASSSSSSSSTTVLLPVSSEELSQIDDVTRSLAERVISLRREKDLVYRKIQEAQQDEMLRQEQKLQLQRSIHEQRKEALLETLHELRDRLEEQRRRLKQKDSSC